MPLYQRHDRRVGLAIVGVAFLLALGFSFQAREWAQPEVGEPPKPPSTSGIVGWKTDVDAIATLKAARQLTPRNLLRGIAMEGVKSAGTLDFSQKEAEVRYIFQSPPGHGPQPPRDHGTLPRGAYCGRQAVEIHELGIEALPDNTEASCTTEHSDGLPEPKCTPARVWELAKAKGAPADRLARVEYYRSKAGPAWRFSIAQTPYRFSWDEECRRQLSDREALGIVP